MDQAALRRRPRGDPSNDAQLSGPHRARRGQRGSRAPREHRRNCGRCSGAFAGASAHTQGESAQGKLSITSGTIWNIWTLLSSPSFSSSHWLYLIKSLNTLARAIIGAGSYLNLLVIDTLYFKIWNSYLYFSVKYKYVLFLDVRKNSDKQVIIWSVFASLWTLYWVQVVYSDRWPRDRLPPELPADPADQAGQPALPAGDAGSVHANQLYRYQRWVCVHFWLHFTCHEIKMYICVCEIYSKIESQRKQRIVVHAPIIWSATRAMLRISIKLVSNLIPSANCRHSIYS